MNAEYLLTGKKKGQALAMSPDVLLGGKSLMKQGGAHQGGNSHSLATRTLFDLQL